MPVLQVGHLAKTFTSGFWPFKKVQTYTVVNGISFQLNREGILGFLVGATARTIVEGTSPRLEEGENKIATVINSFC